jgi:UrcA family protein
MSKIIAQFAAALALTAAPLAALAAPPAVAPVRLDISSVDFSKPDQVAAFKARVGAVQDQMCKKSGNKTACRENIMFKVNAQLTDAQRTAMNPAATNLAAR